MQETKQSHGTHGLTPSSKFPTSIPLNSFSSKAYKQMLHVHLILVSLANQDKSTQVLEIKYKSTQVYLYGLRISKKRDKYDAYAPHPYMFSDPRRVISSLYLWFKELKENREICFITCLFHSVLTSLKKR